MMNVDAAKELSQRIGITGDQAKAAIALYMLADQGDPTMRQTPTSQEPSQQTITSPSTTQKTNKDLLIQNITFTLSQTSDEVRLYFLQQAYNTYDVKSLEQLTEPQLAHLENIATFKTPKKAEPFWKLSLAWQIAEPVLVWPVSLIGSGTIGALSITSAAEKAKLAGEVFGKGRAPVRSLLPGIVGGETKATLQAAIQNKALQIQTQQYWNQFRPRVYTQPSGQLASTSGARAFFRKPPSGIIPFEFSTGLPTATEIAAAEVRAGIRPPVSFSSGIITPAEALTARARAGIRPPVSFSSGIVTPAEALTARARFPEPTTIRWPSGILTAEEIAASRARPSVFQPPTIQGPRTFETISNVPKAPSISGGRLSNWLKGIGPEIKSAGGKIVGGGGKIAGLAAGAIYEMAPLMVLSSLFNYTPIGKEIKSEFSNENFDSTTTTE